MSDQLKLKAAEIEQRRGELDKMFRDHTDEKGEFALDNDQVDEVRRRNDELAQLCQDYEALKELKGIEQENRTGLRLASQPNRLPFPSQRGDFDAAASSSPRPLSEAFCESHAYKGWSRGSGGPATHLAEVDLKTLMSTAQGWAPETSRSGMVIESAQRPLRLLDVVPTTQTQQSSVVYMEETTFDDDLVDEVAEGASFPEAGLAVTERTSQVRKIGVYLPVTDEQLEDEPQVRGYIDSRLTYMLRKKLESQLIDGTNVSGSLKGLKQYVAENKAMVVERRTDPVPDAIYRAITSVMTTGASANGQSLSSFAEPNMILLNPRDWQNVRLLRTADGVYIWGNPSEAGPERLWGLPVVQSTVLPESKAFVVDTQQFCLVYRRGIDVQISNSHGTYFSEGKRAVRADLRAAFIVYRPSAICQVNL